MSRALSITAPLLLAYLKPALLAVIAKDRTAIHYLLLSEVAHNQRHALSRFSFLLGAVLGEVIPVLP